MPPARSPVIIRPRACRSRNYQLTSNACAPLGLIGRLAVDQKYQGQRLDSALIMDAAERAALAEPAIFALTPRTTRPSPFISATNFDVSLASQRRCSCR